MGKNKYSYYTGCRFWLMFFFGFTLAIEGMSQLPLVKRIQPVNSPAGLQITIKGENFGNNSTGLAVDFGGVPGNVAFASDQLIEAVVPPGALHQRISVTNTTSGLTSYSSRQFFTSYGGSFGIDMSKIEDQADFGAESGLFDLCLCDLDGDGLNDVASTSTKANAVSVALNLSTPGNLNFISINTSLGVSVLNITCGDLDGDTKPELVFSQDNGELIFILVNQSTPGNPVFNGQQFALSGNANKRIAINDLDKDGKPELIVTNQVNNTVSVLRNNSTIGNVSFVTPALNITVPEATTTAGLVVEDFNGDGRPEIVVNQYFNSVGDGIFVINNTSSPGNIQLGNVQRFSATGTIINIAAGDVDGDDRPDLVATQLLGAGISVYLNTSGTGQQPGFAAPQNFTTANRPWGIDFGDIDGDGRPDLAVTSITDKTITILNNNSSPGTVNLQRSNKTVQYISRNIRIGDLDGDAKPDIAFTSIDDDTNGEPASLISILRNAHCIIPEITPAGPITVCSGKNLQLQTQSSPGANYVWRRDGVVQASGSNPFLDVTVPGNYTVMLESEGGACQEVSEVVNVQIDAGAAIPPVVVTNNGPICIGSGLNLNAVAAGATQFEWRGPNGFTASGASATKADFTLADAGRYEVDVYSGSCIIETSSTIVEVINAPVFTINRSDNGDLCEGATLTLTLSPDNPGFDYQWFNETGIISGAESASIEVTGSGNYYAEINDLVNPGCSAVRSETTSVRFFTAPSAAFEVPAEFCVATPVAFTNQSMVDNNATVRYQWDFGDGDFSDEANPQHTYNIASQRTVKLNVTYEGTSCEDEITRLVDVLPSPEVMITSPAQELALCGGESLALEVEGDFTTYSWNTGEATRSITVTEPGIYAVEAENSQGCPGIAEITIEEKDGAQVTIDAERTLITRGESVQLFAEGLIDYLWRPGNLLNDSTIADPAATPEVSTEFVVRGQGVNGCIGEASILITVKEQAVVDLINPKNFFTPNEGDDINSTWVIENIRDFPGCQVSIFDQTGNKIFEARPYMDEWDGTHKGNRLPNGVYYFFIKCDGEEKSRSGSITLLR